MVVLISRMNLLGVIKTRLRIQHINHRTCSHFVGRFSGFQSKHFDSKATEYCKISIQAMQRYVLVIMRQDIVCGLSLGGSTDGPKLAHSNAVAEAGAAKFEACGAVLGADHLASK